MTDHSERRSDPRIPVDHARVQVRDVLDDRPLGTLANLSGNGMMLVSSAPFSEGAAYQVVLQWQDDNGASHDVELGVLALWSSAAPGGGAWTGFQIIDIDDAGRTRLATLLEEAPAPAP